MSDMKAGPRWRVVIRSLPIWFVLIAAEMAHCILRAILLVPFVDEFRSNPIGVFTGSAAIANNITFG